MRQQENSASDQTEAAAVRFDPLKLEDPGPTWMRHDLAVARIAIRIVGDTEAELETFVRQLAGSDGDGSDPLDSLLHSFESTAEAFKVVREIVQMADARVIATIARIAEREEGN